MTKQTKYPTFTVRLSKELQEKLKTAKLKSGKDWEGYLKELYENRKTK